jgi:hypothetical protein
MPRLRSFLGLEFLPDISIALRPGGEEKKN